MKRLFLECVVVLWTVWAPAGEMAPFVIPTQPTPDSRLTVAVEPVPADAARLEVRDGHFFVGDRRERIWGVNLSFAACFPEPADAPHIARRMADAGVNNVRFHHMDTAAWPRGILDPQDRLRLHPEALKRLDVFVDQLARHGIRSNINLHVGRAASRALGLPEPNTRYDKIVGIFTPELVEAQEQFARDLLTRTNTARGVRYADDPAVAFVEITNENSLFMWSAKRDLRELPEYYAGVLRGQFNAWLKDRYDTTDALRTAWAAGAEPLGENMLADPAFAMPPPQGPDDRRWQIEQHAGCRMTAAQLDDSSGVRLNIEQADQTNWHLSLKHSPLQIAAGSYYTVTFRARSDQPRSIAYSVGQDRAPWGNLGLSRQAELTAEWQVFRAGFVALADEDRARLAFSVGADPASVELADVRLSPGGRAGLVAGESLDEANVAVFAHGESEPRIRDRWRFLAETEKNYFDHMYRFIRDELDCTALITGTIVFGPCGLYGQSDMDFIDGHAYWQHPRFPGRPWDAGNWTVEQLAMVDHPERATLPRLAAERLAGKPFTVSEYNHPAPNDYQAECIPMLAAYAAAQDWDGIWLYTYSHESDVHRARLNSYFDIDQNPAKWGFMRAGAEIFRRGAVPPLPKTRQVALGQCADDPLADLTDLHRSRGRDMFAAATMRIPLTWQNLLQNRLAVALGGETAKHSHRVAQPPVFLWQVEAGKGTFAVSAEGVRVLVGRRGSRGAGITLAEPAFAAITVTALDGRPLHASRSVLIAACGRAENTGMVFSEDRRTVGRNWGEPPVRVEPVKASIALPGRPWRCHALKPDGSQGQRVPLQREARGRSYVDLHPKYATMWYLLEQD